MSGETDGTNNEENSGNELKNSFNDVGFSAPTLTTPRLTSKYQAIQEIQIGLGKSIAGASMYGPVGNEQTTLNGVSGYFQAFIPADGNINRHGLSDNAVKTIKLVGQANIAGGKLEENPVFPHLDPKVNSLNVDLEVGYGVTRVRVPNNVCTGNSPLRYGHSIFGTVGANFNYIQTNDEVVGNGGRIDTFNGGAPIADLNETSNVFRAGNTTASVGVDYTFYHGKFELSAGGNLHFFNTTQESSGTVFTNDKPFSWDVSITQGLNKSNTIGVFARAASGQQHTEMFAFPNYNTALTDTINQTIRTEVGLNVRIP